MLISVAVVRDLLDSQLNFVNLQHTVGPKGILPVLKWKKISLCKLLVYKNAF